MTDHMTDEEIRAECILMINSIRTYVPAYSCSIDLLVMQMGISRDLLEMMYLSYTKVWERVQVGLPYS